MQFKKPDPLITLIIIAVILAIFFPIHGQAAEWFSIAIKLAIALLFFLYGARLSTREALAGLKHWQLHITILCFTYILFPLIGWALAPSANWIGQELYLGILYLTLVPSTVQSSVAFTSIARGDVAGAIVSASASNLLGVVLTPVLVMLLMTQQSVIIDGGVFLDISIQLLLPFILGQLFRPLVKDIAENKTTKVVDRGSIAMVVYSAFSAGVIEGIWNRVGVLEILGLIIFSIGLVASMLWLTDFIAKKLRFAKTHRIAIQFCGTKKSLATGLPMAAVIFGGSNIGILILPLMIFHQVQLMMCAALASQYARLSE